MYVMKLMDLKKKFKLRKVGKVSPIEGILKSEEGFRYEVLASNCLPVSRNGALSRLGTFSND